MSWGLGVCSVFVRSVSPGPFRRVGWVWRSFVHFPLLRCSGLLPVVCVRFFLPLAFQGWPGSGRVCVCACNIWIDVKLLLFSFSFFSPFNKAGGPSMYCERWSNEAATVHADITADHRDVPAFFMSFFCNGTWLTREPPSRFCQMRCHLMLCAFTAICFSTIFSDVLTSFFEVCILVWSTYDIFGKTFIVLAKYNHEIYFRSNCLGWLHVTGLSSWWISSKIHLSSVFKIMVDHNFPAWHSMKWP